MSRFLKNVILVAVVNLIAYAVGGGDAGVMTMTRRILKAAANLTITTAAVALVSWGIAGTVCSPLAIVVATVIVVSFFAKS
jgi:C4-dicarboxylate transporter